MKDHTLRSIYNTLLMSYGRQHWWPAKTRFEMITGAFLTQNTSWGNVEKAITCLKHKRYLSVRQMNRLSIPKLAAVIKPAGYFNIKAMRLKNFLKYLQRRYRGRLERLLSLPIPVLRQELLSINGVGPETADSIILYAAKKPLFVVDAYTRRIFSRLGLIRSAASYEEIQSYFMGHFPKSEKRFNEFHALIVEHAKRYCRKKPLCRRCPLLRICSYEKRET